MRIAVASRWPYRECLRAASWRRSTSFGGKYSRSRSSAFRGRRGVTVRFTMVEGSRVALGFFMANAAFREETVRIIHFLRKDVEASEQHFWSARPPRVGVSFDPSFALGPLKFSVDGAQKARP